MKLLYSRLLFIAVLLCSGTFVQAQNMPIHKEKLSANTKLYLAKQAQSAVPLKGYVYRKMADGAYGVRAFVKVTPGIDVAELEALGIVTGTKAGDIWTLIVPVDKVAAFSRLEGIEHIDVDMPAAPNLDRARAATFVDSVHKGVAPLPMPYSGKDVVVGIIDAGFDYTHPTLYDTSYSAYRVKKVWEQQNNTGTAPGGFTYGSEYSTTSEILAKAYDIDDETHGIHVAGIAAGSGVGSAADNNAAFRGMAYQSDIVFVGIYPAFEQWTSTGSTDILDGVQYIFDYAASVAKPAVANLSWGGSVGPRDGSGLFSQALDNITGAGKLFTISAGNNGATNVHFAKTFAGTDTIASTFISFSSNLNEKRTLVDMWGDTGASFCLKVKLYNGSTGIDSTYKICLDNNVHEIFLLGTGGDTCFVNVATSLVEFNRKPHLFLDVKNNTNHNVCLTITGASGTVDMWQGIVYTPYGYYGSFTNGGQSWARAGDVNMSISDMASSRTAITVAAYNTKTSFVNVAGQTQSYSGYAVGRLAAFSSKGPAADGRIKPDIVAPGMSLASSVNSYNADYSTGGDAYNSVVREYTSPQNSRKYAYAMAAGTSMSSPAAAGIIALLLEANPQLTVDSLRQIFRHTSIRDTYTGTIPAEGNATWGQGKINAFEVLLYGMGITHVDDISKAMIRSGYMLYPNPASDKLVLSLLKPNTDKQYISIYATTGEQVYASEWQADKAKPDMEISIAHLSNGVYFVSITRGAERLSFKFVKQ